MRKQNRVQFIEALKSGAGAIALTVATVGQIHAQEANSEDAEDETSVRDTIIVTGVRGKPRTVAESPIPIDVFSAEQLETQPQTGIFETLRFLVPSLNMPQRPGGDRHVYRFGRVARSESGPDACSDQREAEAQNGAYQYQHEPVQRLRRCGFKYASGRGD